MGKIAVVTGVASGIGKAIAQKLCEEKIKVIGFDKSEVNIPEIIFMKCDLSVESEIKRCIEKIEVLTDRIDILVNVAGIFCYRNRYYIHELPTEEWEEVFNANLKSTFLLTKFLVRFIKKSKEGCIINISSDQVVKPQVKSAPYAVTKAAIEMFSKIAALELMDDGIRVNTIALSSVRTNFLKSYIKNEERIEKMMVESNQKMPFGLIELEDVNELVIYLINNAKKVTGQTILIDSGTTLNKSK